MRAVKTWSGALRNLPLVDARGKRGAGGSGCRLKSTNTTLSFRPITRPLVTGCMARSNAGGRYRSEVLVLLSPCRLTR